LSAALAPAGASADPMASTGTTTAAQSVLFQRILDPFFVHHVRSQRRCSEPQRLGPLLQHDRRSLFGPPVEVQRLDVGPVRPPYRSRSRVNRVKDETPPIAVRPRTSAAASALRHTRSRSASSAKGPLERRREPAARRSRWESPRMPRLAGFDDGRLCLFGQVLEWACAYFDNRSWQRESDAVVLGGSQAIPDPVLDSCLPPTQRHPTRELCRAAHVGSRAKPASVWLPCQVGGWSLKQPLNEVISSENDSTYDVSR
jgi:hypothetical protein